MRLLAWVGVVLSVSGCVVPRLKSAEYIRRELGYRDQVWLHLQPVAAKGARVAIELASLRSKGERRAMWVYRERAHGFSYERLFILCSNDSFEILEAVEPEWDQTGQEYGASVVTNKLPVPALVVPGSYASAISNVVCDSGFLERAQTAVEAASRLHGMAEEKRRAAFEDLKANQIVVELGSDLPPLPLVDRLNTPSPVLPASMRPAPPGL